MIEKQDIFYFLHSSHYPFIHACGQMGTEAMIELMNLKDEYRVLDFGCGTGATLAKIISTGSRCDLCGYDASYLALEKTRNRLRFCGIENSVTLISDLIELESKLGTFDTIYIESVLAILPKEELMEKLLLLNKLLKLEGRLYCNESIWNSGTDHSEKIRINQICLQNFGIPQCSLTFNDLDSTISTIENFGFSSTRAINLGHYSVEKKARGPIHYLSFCYSTIGKIRSYFHLNLFKHREQIRKVQRALNANKQKYLTGQLLEFRKINDA